MLFISFVLLCLLLLACNNNEPYPSERYESTATTWYKDADGDGYSDGTTQTSVERPSSDYYKESELTAISGDCNDNDDSVNPGATEVCGDGIDQDCNGNDLFCTGGWDSGFWDQDVWGE